MRDAKENQTVAAKSPDAARAARLKAALKANIAKRKAQARARQTKHAPPDNENA